MTSTTFILWAAHAQNSLMMEIGINIMVSPFMFLYYTMALHASAVNSTAIREQKSTVHFQNTQLAMYFQVL
jgi:hypothetical protein